MDNLSKLIKKVFAVLFCIGGLLIFLRMACKLLLKEELSASFAKEIFISQTEESMEEVFPFKSVVKEIYGTSNKLLSPNEDMSAFGVINDNGFLITPNHYDVDYEWYGKQLGDLRDYCNDLGIEFNYASLPAKDSYVGDFKGKYGIESNASDARQGYLKSIRDTGVDVLDVGEMLIEDGYDVRDVFYNTDFHWNVESGLYGARAIAEHIGANTTLLSDEQFERNVYHNVWLGETGRDCSKTWAGKLDDFTLITPKYETALIYSAPTIGGELSGDFGVIIDWNMIDSPPDYYSKTMHYSYLPFSAASPTIIVNEKFLRDKTTDNDSDNAPINGEKVLLIRDSFSVVMAPFLSLTTGELHIWDNRFPNPTTIYDYIATGGFDRVIVAYTDFYSKELFKWDK